LHGRHTINLFRDVFGYDADEKFDISSPRGLLALEDMNYLTHKYVVEVEVIQRMEILGDQSYYEDSTSYLRFITLNHISQS